MHPVRGPGSIGAAKRNPALGELVAAMITDPALSHVCYHISLDDVAKNAVSYAEAIRGMVGAFNGYPDRFLFGADNAMASMRDFTLASTTMTHLAPRHTSAWRVPALATWPAALLLFAAPARASFLEGEALAKAADVMAWVVIIVVPIIAIIVFWMVHVLPEKIAHKRHHPQRDAIQVLCLLSLVFGGLLWPLAWLWAYTKPVLHKMAYGKDKHEDYYKELAEKTPEFERGLHEDVARLRGELDRLVERGAALPELEEIRDRLAALEPRLAAGEEAR